MNAFWIKSSKESYGLHSCMKRLFIYLKYFYVYPDIFEAKYYNGSTGDSNDIVHKSNNARYNYD